MNLNPLSNIMGSLTQTVEGLASPATSSLLPSIPGTSQLLPGSTGLGVENLTSAQGTQASAAGNGTSAASFDQLITNLVSVLVDKFVKPLLSALLGQSSALQIPSVANNTAASEQGAVQAAAPESNGESGSVSQNGGQIMSTITGVHGAVGSFYALF